MVSISNIRYSRTFVTFKIVRREVFFTPSKYKKYKYKKCWCMLNVVTIRLQFGTNRETSGWFHKSSFADTTTDSLNRSFLLAKVKSESGEGTWRHRFRVTSNAHTRRMSVTSITRKGTSKQVSRRSQTFELLSQLHHTQCRKIQHTSYSCTTQQAM